MRNWTRKLVVLWPEEWRADQQSQCGAASGQMKSADFRKVLRRLGASAQSIDTYPSVHVRRTHALLTLRNIPLRMGASETRPSSSQIYCIAARRDNGAPLQESVRWQLSV